MTALTSHRSGETLSRGQEKDEPRPELTRQLRQGMKDSSGCQKAPRHLSAIRCIPSLFSRKFKLKSLPKGRPHVETVEMRARRMDSPSERGAHCTLTHTRDKRAAVCKMAVVRRARRGVVIRAVGERFLFPTVGPSLCMIFINAGRQRRKEHRPHTRHFPPFSSFLLTTVHSLRHPCSKRGRMKRQC